jgi:hypothetical protein
MRRRAFITLLGGAAAAWLLAARAQQAEKKYAVGILSAGGENTALSAAFSDALRVILAPASGPAVAAKRATATIPIVSPALADAVHLQLLLNEARSRGNATFPRGRAVLSEGGWDSRVNRLRGTTAI